MSEDSANPMMIRPMRLVAMFVSVTPLGPYWVMSRFSRANVTISEMMALTSVGLKDLNAMSKSLTNH